MGEIKLHINNLSIAAGKDITGYVLIDLPRTIDAKFLTFLFTGKEKTSFKKSSVSGKYFKEYKGNLKSIRIELGMHEWKSGVLESGKHKFPFVFEIPFDLPGSFYLKTPKLFGSISYYIKVRLADIHRIPLLKAKEIIDIIQFLDIKEAPTVEFETPLISCNCINRGFCITTIEMSKPKFVSGETANIKIIVNASQAKVDINSIECILWMNCRFLSSDKKVHFFRKCIFFFQHTDTIKASDTLLVPKELDLEIPLTHPTKDISRCHVTFGKIIQCTYSLQVTLEFGSIITEEPDMQIPVYISSAEESSKFLTEEKFIRLSRDMY